MTRYAALETAYRLAAGSGIAYNVYHSRRTRSGWDIIPGYRVNNDAFYIVRPDRRATFPPWHRLQGPQGRLELEPLGTARNESRMATRTETGTMAGMIRFLEDENDRGTQRLVEYVPRDGRSVVLHEFLSWGPKGQKWMTVPGCCPNDDHRLE